MKPNTQLRAPQTRLTGIEQIMLKFYFTNEALVPTGVRLENRDEAAINSGHVERAAKSVAGPGAATLGRVRFGHRDNGNHWADNSPNVCGGVCAHPTIVGAGYNLADIHYYHQKPRQKPGGAPAFGKWVVVLTYDADAEKNILKNPSSLEEGPEREAATLLASQLERLMKFSWGYLHGWNNADGGSPTITLNFNHCQKGQDGENAVVVDGETMKIVPVREALAILDQQRARRRREREAGEVSVAA